MDMLRVLAPVWGDESDLPCVQAAAAVASPSGAQILALAPEIDPLTTLAWAAGAGGYMSPDVVRLMQEGEEARAESARQAAATVRKALPVASREDAIVYSRVRGLNVFEIVADACAASDLAVFVDGAAFRGERRQAFQSALISAGTPCLLVRNPDLVSGQIAVAWDGSAHAGRALRAAMPLIRARKQVTILHAPLALSQHRRRAAAPEDLLHLLTRQGIDANMPAICAGARDGSELLKAAGEIGASLFVAGAFGHPRAQEFLFGGATQAFLDASNGPSLLLAH